MPSNTIYKVKLVGDTTDFVKKMESAGDVVENLKKEADSITFGLNFENKTGLVQLLQDIKADTPDLEIQIRFELMKGYKGEIDKKIKEINNGFNSKEEYKDLMASYFSMDPEKMDGPLSEWSQKYLGALKEEIETMAKNLKPEDADALKEKILRLLDINSLVKQRFGMSFGFNKSILQDLKSKGIDTKGIVFKDVFARLKDLREEATKYERLAERAASEARIRGWDPEKGLRTEFSTDGEIKKNSDEASDNVKKVGEEIKNVGKNATNAKNETNDALNGIGNAAGNVKKKIKEAGNEIENTFTNIKGLDDLIKKLESFIQLLQRALGITETIESTGVLENILKGAVENGYTSRPSLGKYLKKELSDELYNDKTVQNILFSTSGIPSGQNGKIREDYEQWAKEVISAMEEAGKSVDAFVIKKQEITGKGLLGGAKLDDEQVAEFKVTITDIQDKIESLVKTADRINQTDLLKIKTDDVNSFLDILKEIIYELQQMNGLVTSSRLDEEFARIAKDANALGKGSFEWITGGYQKLQNIVERFERYKSAGGTRSFNAITNDVDLKYKLGKVRRDLKSAAAADAAAKEASNAQKQTISQNLKDATDKLSSLDIDNLITKLRDLFSVLNESVDDNSFIKELENLASYGSALDSMAEILKQSSAKIKSAAKTVRKSVAQEEEKPDPIYLQATSLLKRFEDYKARDIYTATSESVRTQLEGIIAAYELMESEGKKAFDSEDAKGYIQVLKEAEGVLGKDFANVDEKMRQSAAEMQNLEKEIVKSFSSLGKDAGRYITAMFGGKGEIDTSFTDNFSARLSKAFENIDTFKNSDFVKNLTGDVATQMTQGIDSAMSDASEKMRVAIMQHLEQLGDTISGDPTLRDKFSKSFETLFDKFSIEKFDAKNLAGLIGEVKDFSSSISNFKNNMITDSDTDALAKLGERISALDDQVLSVRFKGLSKAFENFNPAIGSVEKLRSEINALSNDTSKVESDLKSATSSLTSEFNSISGRFKEFVTLSSTANQNVIQTGMTDSFISDFQKLQEAVKSFEKEFGFVPENISNGMKGLNEAMQKALVDALSVTSKMKDTLTSDKYSDSFKTELYGIRQELSKYISEVNGFDSSKIWDVSKVREYLGEIARLVSEFNQLKASASGEDLIKSNSITQRDKDSLQNIRSRVHDITDSELLEGDNGFIKRIANLNAAFKSFDPAKNSISELRSEMKLLKDDIEAAIKSAKKFAAESAKADKQVFGDFEKSTKGMTKVIGKGEDKTAFEKDQWASYIEEYGKAVETAAGRGLSELPKSAENAVNEIAKVISSSVELEQRVKSIQENSGQYTQEYIESLSGLKEAFKTLHDMFPNNDFSIIKKLGLSGEDLDKALKAIDEIMSKVSASTSGKYAEKEIVSKTYERATGLLSGLTDSGLRDQVSGIVDELKNAMQGGEGLDKTLANMSTERLQELNTLLSQIGGQANETGGRLQTFANIFTKSLTGDMASMVMRFTSIRYLWRYAKQMAQATTQIDSAITELRKVSGESNIRLQESFKTSAETAQKLGSTITEVINSTADWARLGYSIDQAEDLARVTQLFKTVGDNMTQETASKSLVSILQGYKIDASQAERTVDSINEVANNFAIDTAGIGDALQRSAASLNAAGTDLNKSIALVTTSNAVLQNPETVGTMFKTLSARIRGAKTELADLGEEEDEYTETTSKLQKLVKQLTGFDIMQDKDTYKDIYTILVGIGKEWKNLTDIEQASLGEALAGKRGANALYAVLNNIDTLEKAYKTAEGAEGSAAREQEAYAQSVQYSIDRLKASIEELSVSVMSSDFIKGWIEFANSFIRGITKMTEGLGSLGSVLTGLGTIGIVKFLLSGGKKGLLGAILRSSVGAFAGSKDYQSIPEALGMLFGAKSAGVVTKAAADTGTAAGTAMVKSTAAAVAGSKALLLGGIATLAAGIGLAVFSMIRRYKKKLVDTAKAEASEWTKDKENIDEQFKQVQELRDKYDNDETLSDNERLEIKKQIYEIQKQITSEYGSHANGIDLINGKLETQRQLLTNISEEEARRNQAVNAAAYAEARKKAYDTQSASGFRVGSGLAKEVSNVIEQLDLETAKYGFDNGEFTLEFEGGAKYITEDVNKISDALLKLKERYENVRDSATLADFGNDTKAYSDFIYEQNRTIAQIDMSINTMVRDTKGVLEDYKNVKDTIEQDLVEQFYAKGYGEYEQEVREAIEAVNDAVIEGDSDAVSKAFDNYKTKLEELKEAAGSIHGFDKDTFVASITKDLNQAGVEAVELKQKLVDIDKFKVDDSALKVLEKKNDEIREEYIKEYKLAEKAGLQYYPDYFKTKFGNVDLGENRGRLEWTKENIDKYELALRSWAKDSSEYSEIFTSQGEEAAEKWIDGYINEFRGSYSTAFGAVDEFYYWQGDNEIPINIAYTPIVKNEDTGELELVDPESIRQYIQGIINDSTDENGVLDISKMFTLDETGLNKTFVQYKGKLHHMIAEVGDDAIKTGEAMHFSGFDGSINTIKREYSDIAEKLVLERHRVNDALNSDEAEYKKWADSIKGAAFDVVDYDQMMSSATIDFTKATYESEQDLQRLAKTLGVAFDGTDEDKVRIDALRNALVELGWITDSTADRASMAANKYKVFRDDITKTYSSIDSVNSALANAVTGKGLSVEYDEQGDLAGDIGSIINAYQKLDNFHAGDIFRITANGVKINTEAMRKLQKEQDKITRSKFLQQQKQLTNDLATAEKNRAMATRDDMRRQYEKEIETLKTEISQLDYLQAAYEGATSAYQQWLNAQSAGEEGDVYDNMRDTMVKRADELYKAGLVGTEEFRKIAQVISGKDLTTASIDDVVSAYKNLDATISDTDKKVRDFFKEGSDGCLNFIDAMVDLGVATEENGVVKFEELDTEAFAKKLGTSVDIVEALLGKLKDYGFEIKWLTKEQRKQLNEFDKQYSYYNKNLRNQEFAGMKFDLDELDTVEELQSAIDSVKRMLADPMQYDIDTSQAEALNELLTVLIEKRNILERPTTVEDFDVAQYREAKKGLSLINGEIKEINESGLDLQLSDEAKEYAEWIQTLPDDIKKKLNIEITGSTEELLAWLGYGREKRQANPNVVKPAKATEYQQRQIVNTTENRNTTVNKEITDSETHTSVTVDDSGVDESKKKWDEAKEDIESGAHGTITERIEGKERLDELNKAKEEADEDVDADVDVHVKGAEKLRPTKSFIDSFNDKSVRLSIETQGVTALQEAFNKWKSFVPNATKKQFLEIHTKHITDYYEKPGTVNGTAHASGTIQGFAHAGGKWGLPNDQNALINEVGPEIVVRGSNWFIPNGGRPTMGYPLKKGDIIFNAKQSEELLKNGYVAHGYAKASGTAGGPAHADTGGSGPLEHLKRGKTNASDSDKKSNEKAAKSSEKAAKSSENAAKSNEETAENLKDWVEVLLNRIAKTFEDFKSMADYWTTYINKNRELNNAINQAFKNITDNQKAYQRYMQEANKVGLSDAYKKKVQNGELNIENIKDEKLREKIDKYTEWYDKALACKDTIRDLNKEVYELSRQKIENLIKDYESFNEYTQAAYENASKLNEVYTKRVGRGNKNNLAQMAKQQNNLYVEYAHAYKRIQDEMNAQLANGTMKKNSEAYRKARTDLVNLKNAMLEVELEIYNINEAIREVNWKNWENALKMLEHVDSQIGSTVDLIGDLNNYNEDNARITDAGIAKYDLYSSALANARQKVANLNTAIATLDKEFKEGVINEQEYNEQMQEYREQQMAAAGEVKKHRDAIISLIKEGIEAETKAMEKLTDARKEALKKQKEADDYARSVSDKTTEINKIRAKIAAMAGDDTMATQAKVAKLREELANKEEDLARTRQDHEYDEMVKALDDGLEAFKETQDEKTRALSDSLANQEAAIENSLSWTTTQYKTTYDELTEISRSFGIDLEDFLTKPWKSATAAAKTFEEATTKAMKSNAGISTTGYQTINKNKAADGTGSVGAGNSYVEGMSNPTTDQKKNDNKKSSGDSKSGKKIAGSFSGASLWFGNTNKVSDVKYLQQLLNAIMGTNMTVDGVFGPKTEAAVKAFQSKYGIGADGVFGKKSRAKMLEVAKKLGYARRGKRNARGLYITDEQGLGSEAIITKEGVLRQLDSDTVFSKKQTEALWNISKMSLDNAMKVSSRGANVNITYGSLLTVTGDVTKDALPGLEEILKKACEYTKRDITASMSKLGFR